MISACASSSRSCLRPSRRSREVKLLHCRAEAARVLVQEPRSPRAAEHGDESVLSELSPIDDERCWYRGALGSPVAAL